jgi:tetratricopeptide (TPR) repeat protein
LEYIDTIVYRQPGPLDRIEQIELSYELKQALKAIPENLRVVTILFYISGYSQQEIAGFLDVSVQTVKSRLYASRQRLKERMLTMAQNEFENHPLSDQFTQNTVSRALQRAEELSSDQQYEDAEKILRSIIANFPENPEVLRKLNQVVMVGKVYGQGQWDLLTELADRGQEILKNSDDIEIHRQVVHTLLAIPAMPAAIKMLENWIHEKGPDLERLGMLAWAKACSGEVISALATWNDLIALAQAQGVDQVVRQLPFITYTLVDAISSAASLSEAQNIARQAWNVCGRVKMPPQEALTDDSDWMTIWHLAEMDKDEILTTLLDRHIDGEDITNQAVRLAILGWVEPAETCIKSWQIWAQQCIATGNFSLLERYRLVILNGIRRRGFTQAANQLARSIWGFLGESPAPDAHPARIPWDWERFNPVPAVNNRQWQQALDLVEEEIQTRGVHGAVGWAAIVAGGSGAPTPGEILEALQLNGVEGVDEYGMFGWYILARETAHDGDTKKAFDALRNALKYWSNPPYWITDLWEQDTYWGTLRNKPQFRAAFEERRKRIGTIYGQLHYFPKW